MFSSSILPIRHSEVRQFAMNNSLTMSTSELEDFMDTSVTSQTMGQHSLIKQGEKIVHVLI